MSYRKLLLHGALSVAALTLSTPRAIGHELWIEADPAGKIGSQQQVDVCWGHSGERTPRELLEKQKSRLSARAVRPNGSTEDLELALAPDRFSAKITPDSAGYHLIGAELQAGIIDKELHGIPANTRIVMYGKSLTHVAGGSEGLGNKLGFDLELVPVTHPDNLHPGDVVTVKLLLRGKPLGGREAVVSLGTTGPDDLPQRPGLPAREWSIEAHADPRTGEASFPLIVAGRHVFRVRYFDETPGIYQGPIDEASEFSHLRKGDTFERTMYVATFAVEVTRQ